MYGADIPITSSISSAWPDSPNRSGTPTISSGAKELATMYSATALPSPPMTLWSSAVTRAPHCATRLSINSPSIGLSVCISTTVALIPSSASASAALSDSDTKTPQEIMATSYPSLKTTPFPI